MELFQAIPRMLWLDSSGKQLLQWPVKELETLRGEKVQISNKQLEKGDHVEIKGITAAQVCYLQCILFNKFSDTIFIYLFIIVDMI